MSLIGDICNFSCIISFQNAHPECVYDISCHPSTEVHYHEGNLQKNMLQYIKNVMTLANFCLFCPLKGHHSPSNQCFPIEQVKTEDLDTWGG